MNNGDLVRRVCVFGEKTVLGVYADIPSALDILDLSFAPESAGHERPPDMRLFMLGGKRAGRESVEVPNGAALLFESGLVTVSSQGQTHYGGWFGKAKSVYARDRKTAVLVMPGMRRYLPDFVARFIFRPILDRMLWDAGYLPLHAAAISGHRGCLLVGESGSGKTTLLLDLLEKGAEFFGDDRALVTWRNGRAELHAFPERIRVAADSIGRKRPMRPPVILAHRAPLRYIVFLERSAGPLVSERLGCAEVAARLIRAVSPYLGKDERFGAVEMAERLAGEADGRLLRGWGSRGERITNLMELTG